MNIEQKAKAYDEALERAKGMRALPADKATVEYIFPELRESEDERIRKALIEALKTAKTVGELKFTLPEPTREECIAYLERQKKIIDSITALKITIRPDGGIERPTIGYLEKQEQKPAWSDEDEKIRQSLLRDYEYAIQSSGTVWGEDFKKKHNWRKSLPERINVQAKQEWSEADYSAYSIILNEYKQMYERRATSLTRDDIEAGYNFLKSLRPSWKPSEEQIESLRWIIDNSRPNTEHETLCSLLDDLLKLK